jgi:hypothetical protein
MPQRIARPAEWRVAAVRTAREGIELLAVPRTLDLLETES